jgi:hypothetical protein
VTSYVDSSTAGSITGGTCETTVTDGSGQCTIIVNSDVAGSITVGASVALDLGLTSGATVDRSTDGTGSNSGPATKTWVAGSLVWHKVDDMGDPLGGATFEVCRTHDRFGVDIADECVSVLDNNAPDEDAADGEFLMTGLKLGTWTIQETAPPAGYTGDLTIVETLVLTIPSPDGEVTTPWVNYPPLEGCTPGWWKNQGLGAYDEAGDALAIAVTNAVADKWYGGTAPVGFDGTTGSLFRVAFNLTVAEMEARGLDGGLTLLEAVELGGGDFNALARHGTSGLLNSLSVDYGFSANEVLDDVHDAFISGNIGSLVSDLDTANKRDHGSCPSS